MTTRASFAVGSTAALLSIGIVRSPARAAQFEWKYGNDLDGSHPLTVRAVQAFELIRADTKGDLSIKPFPNSQLGGDPAMITQLRSGALEMAGMPGGLMDVVVPVAAIESTAYAFKDEATAYAAFDGELGKIVRADMATKANLIALERIWDNGFRNFTSNIRPIRSDKDLDGLRVRAASGKLRVDSLRSMGASPTVIATPDVYVALQTHIVDGQESPFLTVESQRWFEVQKYGAVTNHMWGGYWIVINGDKWNALPPSYQNSVRKRMNDAALLQRRDVAILNLSLQDKLQRQGLALTPCDRDSIRARLIANGYYQRWSAEFGPVAWSALEKYTGKLG